MPYLLRQRTYNDHMDYGPTWTVDVEGDEVYSQVNLINWWWVMQDRLPLGATIVPLICGSDEMQLTYYTGDKSAWPIYLTTGNIYSFIWNKYSYLTLTVLAFRQVLSKFQRNSTFND